MAKKKVVTNMAMKIGYIQEIDLQLNPQYKERCDSKKRHLLAEFQVAEIVCIPKCLHIRLTMKKS